MADEVERLRILEMIEKGQITAQDGIRLLEALNGVEEGSSSVEALPLPDELYLAEDAPLEDASHPAQELLPEAELQLPDALYPMDEPDRDEAPPTPETPEASFQPASAAAPQEQTEAPRFQSEPEVVPPPERFDPNRLKWRGFWWIPMLVGVGITLVAALLMYAAWNSGGFGFWFACTWFPFLLGVVVMALAWASRTARWLHVRVQQKEGQSPQRISISFPIPLRLTAWFLRTFGKNIPHLGDTGLDELIMALDATSPETPFYVEVNEGANGEHVEVYIG